MILRKFYNADVVDTPAATEQGETPSLASLMATQGAKSEGNHGDSQIQNKENTEKPTETETPTPAAIATEVVKVEEVTETPTPTVVQDTTPTPTIEAAKVPEQSWQEVAQKQPNEVFKALGYDEKVVGFIKDLKEVDPKMLAFLETWKSGGDLTGYLREMTTDYSKLSAEQMMRHHIRQSYPKADERQLEVLYRTKVENAYNLNSDDEELKEEGQLLLEAEADQYREKYTESQKNFLLPKPPEAKANEADTAQAAQQQQVAEENRKFNEAYMADVNNNAVTKNIISNKAYSIGDGEGKFNFPVEPNDVLGILFDTNKFKQALWETQVDANGDVVKVLNPKTEHQLLVATVMKYGMPFIEKIKDHYTSLGTKSAIAPIDNAKLPDNITTSNAEAKPTSIAGAMAKQGVYSAGGG